MGLLLHTDTVVMLYVPDLLWRHQLKLLMNYPIYVYMIPEEQIPCVRLCYYCMIVYQYMFIVFMYGEPPREFSIPIDR